jgi:hypothetical protein
MRHTIAFSILIIFFSTFSFAQTQSAKRRNGAVSANPSEQAVVPASGGNPVVGSGTTGQIPKWLGQDGANTFTIGNSNISEDKFGKVGIGGPPSATSLLTVRGMIETTLGGYKFPDGTIQTTAGLSFVTHDASLVGLGTAASPLGIANGGVQTIHLANNAVTAAKIANGTVVRSFNGLFDNVSLVAGSNITITPTGNTLTIASPNSLTSIAHDSTLTGAGTTASPLGVADGGIGTLQLADGAVTLSKIALNQVVTRLNNLTESVTLAAGPNITITPSGNTLTIAGASSSGTAYQATSTTAFVFDPPGQDVVSKQVLAGSYIIFFKIGLSNNDDSPQDVTCTLSTGDSAHIRLAEAGDGGRSAILVLQDAATFSATTTITAHCSGFQILSTFPGRAVLTALRVGSIQ